jgi:diguanylate cyclase (GGDEF)-like protein
MRTLLLRMRDEQERQNRMFGEVLNRLPFPVLVTDNAGNVVLANPAATTLTGPLAEARVRTANGTPVDLSRLAPGESGLELLVNEQSHVVVETVPTESHTIVALLDVTARRGYEERMEHAAFHDPLTGLPNRALLWRHFEAVADGQYAVLLLDLDGFKAVNDTYGHQAGDELLCRTAEMLRPLCGPDATVARLGGDEFAVLLPGGRQEHAAAMAAAIRDAFAAAMPLTTGPVRVGGSVGYGLGCPGRSPEEVLAAADDAMYADKHSRRSLLNR